jgi:hypothetical protein
LNNLRRDIHSAFKGIEPPLGGMPERVVQAVLAEKNSRLRKERMLVRLRVPLAMVAAGLIVAVVVAAIITWNALHTNVAPAGHSGLTPLQQLESRPLQIPIYHNLADCKPSPVAQPYGWGSPIAGYGQLAYATDWGYYFRNIFYTDTPITGPILIRGRDVFNSAPDRYVGDFAAGPVIGTDTVGGTRMDQHSEIVLSEDLVSTNFASDLVVPTGKRFIWEFVTGVPKTYSGYVGWQIDAVGLSEVVLSC